MVFQVVTTGVMQPAGAVLGTYAPGTGLRVIPMEGLLDCK